MSKKTVEALLYYIIKQDSYIPSRTMFTRIERDVAEVQLSRGFILDKSLTYRASYEMDRNIGTVEKANALRKVYKEQDELAKELDVAVKTLAKNIIENLG